MIKNMLLFIFLCVFNLTHSQSDSLLYLDYDIKPMAMEGEKNPRLIISRNLNYPNKAARNDVFGRVVISFIIKADGTITDLKVASSVHPLLDKEALRAVKLTDGCWIPGIKEGQKVDSYAECPVSFLIHNYDGQPIEYYYENGNKYYLDKDYENAIIYLEEIRKREPYNFENLHRLMDAYYYINNNEMACKYYKRFKLYNINPKLDYKIECND